MENTDQNLIIKLTKVEGKIDSILERLDKIESLETRVRNLEIECKQVEELQKDVEKLESKSDNWNLLNSVGIFLAGVVGVFINRP